MTDGALPIIPVSARLKAKLVKMFMHEEIGAAELLLEQRCGASLTSDRIAGIERIRCAAIKLSNGSLQKLSIVLDGAERDWRDTLVAAGFANDVGQHLAWLAEAN